MAALGQTGISTTLVKQTIGAGTNDVAALCTHKNINKWSYQKPIALSTAATLGFELMAKPELEMTVYDYRPPKGGAVEPYRLGDFRGYDHAAEPPQLTYPKDKVTIQAAKYSFDLTYILPELIHLRLPFLQDESLYMAVVDANIIKGPEDYVAPVYGLIALKGSGNRFQFKIELTGLNFSAGVITRKTFIVAILKKKNLSLPNSQANNFELFCTIGDPIVDMDSMLITLEFEGYTAPAFVPTLDMTAQIRNSFTYTSVVTELIGEGGHPEDFYYFILDIKFVGVLPLNSSAYGTFLTLTHLDRDGNPGTTFSLGQLIPERVQDFTKRVNIDYHDFTNTFRVTLPHEPVNL